MVLVLDTATDDVLIGIWDEKWLAKNQFPSGRELNAQIITELENTFSRSLECEKIADCFHKLTGVIVNSGPGSFTGLRIGLSVANTIAYTEDVPIVGVEKETDPEKLLQKGLSLLKSRGASYEGVVLPFYGSEPHITRPKG